MQSHEPGTIPSQGDPELRAVSITDLQREQVMHRFGPYRIPTDLTKPKFKAIQEKALEFALLIHDLAPHSQQKAIALTYLEAVKMSANAAIALHSAE